MYKILVIEDSVDIQNLVQVSLAKFECYFANTLAEADSFLNRHIFDLILVDVMLPDGDGFQYCAKLLNDNKYSSIPTMIMTAKDTVDDKVMGYTIGVDDYVVKPFDPRELKVRVEARLKKAKAPNENRWLRKGLISINIQAQKVHLKVNNDYKEVDLTPTEYKILVFLFQNEDVVFTRNDLMDNIWGSNTVIVDRVVDIHVSGLRKKLEKHAKYIMTVYGSGYKFSTENVFIDEWAS